MGAHIIEVKVKAGAKSRSIEKMDDGTYKIKTPVVPEKRRANKAVVEILSKHLDIPKSNIQLISGASSSHKRFKITK